MVIFLDICGQHPLQLLLLILLLTIAPLNSSWSVFSWRDWGVKRVCSSYRQLLLFLLFNLVWILKFRGNIQHNGLCTGRYIDMVWLDHKFDRTLSLILIIFQLKLDLILTSESCATHGCWRLGKVEFNFEVVLAQIPEWNAELLQFADAFQSNRNNLLLLYFWLLVLVDLGRNGSWTYQFWNMNLTCKEDF